MKGLIVTLLLVCFTLGGCSSSQRNDAKEKAVQAIASSGSAAITSALECKRPDLIKAKLEEELRKLSVFEQEAQEKVSVLSDHKGVGSSICQVAVTAVLPILVGYGMEKVPAEWECSGEAAQVKLSELAQKACSQVQF
jgi:uncharacterized lipoprotein NlpE involved in copper resistance